MLRQAGQILLSRITWVGNELVYVEILRMIAHYLLTPYVQGIYD